MPAESIHMALFMIKVSVGPHCGHPDVFDRLCHLTRAGVSKALNIINLSDVFAGMS